MRIILHMDMDAFFAAVEEREDPSLRGKPVVVGGRSRRSVVSTANYVAREYGLHSALPMATALRRCPHVIIRPVNMQRYASISRQIMEVLHGFSPLVEPLSLDEAFLDMSGSERLFGPPMAMAEAIRQKVHEVTRLTCSVGIASNKFLAKLASDLDKPDGITLVPFGKERAFIAPLPVSKLWGVGPKAAARLESLGLHSIGQVADADRDSLKRRLGSMGPHLWSLARAEDSRPVISNRERKSVGAEITLSQDMHGRVQVEHQLRQQCNRTAKELRRKGWKAQSIRVKVRYTENFHQATRDGKLALACDDSDGLFDGCAALLDRLDLDAPIRLVGVTAFDLLDSDEVSQKDLFLQTKRDQHSRIEHTMDAICARYGDKIRRGDGS